MDYLMVIDTVEFLWNLCGIYEERLWKSMVPQHIVEGQCGMFYGNYKEIWWKIQLHSVEFNVKL